MLSQVMLFYSWKNEVITYKIKFVVFVHIEICMMNYPRSLDKNIELLFYKQY